MLVPVYTRFGYGNIDLAKYEKMLEDTGSDASRLVQINFDQPKGCTGSIQVSPLLFHIYFLSLAANQPIKLTHSLQYRSKKLNLKSVSKSRLCMAHGLSTHSKWTLWTSWTALLKS